MTLSTGCTTGHKNALRISTLVPIFGSAQKAQEIALVLCGAKPLVRQGFTTDELNAVREFVTQHRLSIAVSDWSVELLDAQQAYSNAGRVLSSASSNSLFMAYIAAEHSTCLRAKEAEAGGDHMLLGELLGYPRCCCNYFTKNFSVVRADLSQPVVDWRIDLRFRHLDLSIISHFACSASCHLSIALSATYIQALEEFDAKHARQLCKQLQEQFLSIQKVYS